MITCTRIFYRAPGLLRRSLGIVVLFAASCIDPINLDISGQGGLLVVEGVVTDQPGPYTIKISRSIPYKNDNVVKVFNIPETKAKVSILDELGNVSVLIECLSQCPSGSYLTNGLLGRIGGSYQLIIETSDGKKYRSTFDEMKPVPSIASLQPEFVISEKLITNSAGDARVQKVQTFAIWVTVNDPAERGNFYRWKSQGVFEFFTRNDLPNLRQCWAPQQYSIENGLEIAGDDDFNGNLHRQSIATVQYDRPTRYRVTLRQYSLSEPAYRFWKKIRDQQVSTGSLFDAPPSPIIGNITNDLDPEEEVLGYFGASAMTQTYVVFDRFVVSGRAFPANNIPIAGGDCRFLEPQATNVPPEGF